MIILDLDVKKTMSSLLLSETFDQYQFAEAEITTFNTFHIDGYLHKEFYKNSPDGQAVPDGSYSKWADVRELCFKIIKGKNTPLSFHLIFSLTGTQFFELTGSNDTEFSADTVQGVYLNFKYDGTCLKCTTGSSFKTFTMDKSLDRMWDSFAAEYFHKINLIIPIEL